MIELKLTSNHFDELIKKGYSLDMLFILKLYKETNEGCSGPKFENIIQTMIRKGLLAEDETLTTEGEGLIKFLSSTDERPKIPRKKRPIPQEDNFNRWWKTYPGTDTFEYKGKKFKGTRAIKVKKTECKEKVEKILREGEYNIDELVEALKLEVEQKMENSFKTGQNKMSYMQNSLTYLNQHTYEPFIELVRAGHKVQESKPSVAGGIQI